MYLKALEEIGRIKILQDNPGDGIAKTEGGFDEDADHFMQETRDSRIQAALTYLRCQKWNTVRGPKRYPGERIKESSSIFKDQTCILIAWSESNRI